MVYHRHTSAYRVSMIFRRAPFSERAKGPFISEQPLGSKTRWEANSFKVALKCPPRSPKWFMESGMKRLEEVNCIGPTDLASFMNFTFSAFLIGLSELLDDKFKHERCIADETTMSMTESLRCKPLPIA